MFKFELPIYGLGTLISFLSMVLKADTEVEVLTNQINVETFEKLGEIFSLDLRKVKLCLTDSEIANSIKPRILSDWLKLYSPYLTADYIKFKNEEISLVSPRTKKKPMIGLTCYRHITDLFHSKDDDTLKAYPYTKIYSIEDYASLWLKIKTFDYDVVSLDQPITLEDKCFIMKEYCDAVVGYEGGMMHLAHCLKIPSIILPSRYDNTGQKVIGPYYVHDLLHLDKRTYFLKSKEEFLSLSSYQFKDLVEGLTVESLYNNFYLNRDIKVVSVDRWQLPNTSTIGIDLFGLEKQFIAEFYKSLNIGGYEYV